MKLPQHKFNMDFGDSLPHSKAWKNLWIHSVKLFICIVQAIPLIFYFFFKIQNVVFYVLPSFVFLFFDNQSWIPILTHDFKPDVWNELILLAGGLMISCFMISFQMKHYILTQLTSFILIFRWNHEHLFWKFSFLKNWDVKIFDVLVIFTVVLYFIKWIRVKNKEITPNEGFLDDLPLKLSKDDADKLGFSTLVKRLKKIIEKTHSETAICIGITGEWGSGKTSFMHLFEELTKKNEESKNEPEINESEQTKVQEPTKEKNAKLIKIKEIKVLKFSPWRSGSKDAIIKDFFDTLADELSQDNPFLRWKTQRYADKLLTSVTENKLIHAISGIFHDQSSQKLYDEINETVKNLPYTLVVMIDDLDRMDSAEIMSVLKIIRNAANFGNLFFILAYDRTKIDQAILEEKIPDAEKFLDKIVNVEISLPAYPENAVKDVFVAELSKLIIKNETKNVLSQIEEHDFKLLNFRSLRDVKRFINGYRIHYLDLLNEDKIDLRDSLLIESLRESNPKIFNQLKDFVQFGHNDFELFRVKVIKNERTYFEILVRGMNDENERKKDADEIFESVPDEISLAWIINSLFETPNQYVSKKHKSIIYADQIHYYFRFEERNDFSYSLYLSYLGKSEKEFYDWSEKLYYDSQNNLNRNFFTLLSFLKESSKQDESVLNKFVTILLEKLENEDKLDLKTYLISDIPIFNDSFVKEFQERLYSHNLVNLSNALYFLQYIHSYIQKNSYLPPDIYLYHHFESTINLQDLTNIQIKYLEKYLEQHEWNSDAIGIYNCCLEKVWRVSAVDHQPIVISEYLSDETKEKLKLILSRNINDFVTYLLENEQDNDVQRFFKNRWYLFEKFVEIKEFLQNLNPEKNNVILTKYIAKIDWYIDSKTITKAFITQHQTIWMDAYIRQLCDLINSFNPMNQEFKLDKTFQNYQNSDEIINAISRSEYNGKFELEIKLEQTITILTFINHEMLQLIAHKDGLNPSQEIRCKPTETPDYTTFLENVKTYITKLNKND